MKNLLLFAFFVSGALSHADVMNKAAVVTCNQKSRILVITAVHDVQRESQAGDSKVLLGMDLINGTAKEVKGECVFDDKALGGKMTISYSIGYREANGRGSCGSDPTPWISVKIQGSLVTLPTGAFDSTCESVPSINNLIVGPGGVVAASITSK